MNIFRVPFLMERLVPGDMTSDPDSAYMKGLKSVGICSTICGMLKESVANGWVDGGIDRSVYYGERSLCGS